MRKLDTFIVIALLIATVILLGLYSADQLGGNATHVENYLYESGGFTFSGQLVQGQFDGVGSLDFEDNSNFQGNFTYGRFDGDGQYVHTDESAGTYWRFDGRFHEGSAIAGTFYLENGKTLSFEQGAESPRITDTSWEFVGNLPNNDQSANGTFTFSDGTVYEGNFLNGLANGEGVLTNSDGYTIYSGSFVAGLFHGQGTYFSPDGWVFQGGFENGQFHGEGQFREGTIVIQGVWENGFQIIPNE